MKFPYGISDFRQVIGEGHAVDDPEAVAVLDAISAEVEVGFAVIVHEDVAVDGRVAEVEPRGIEILVRPFGLVADGQGDKQSRRLGFLRQRRD